MNTKLKKNYLYDGLGFPVKLEQVEMVFIDNEWHPKIDVLKVAENVIEQLALQETRLTGNQIKFIRSYFGMSLRDFGQNVVHESHMAVSKWEKAGDSPTKMNLNTEHELRLYIMEKKFVAANFSKSKFYDMYLATKRFFSCEEPTPSMIQVTA